MIVSELFRCERAIFLAESVFDLINLTSARERDNRLAQLLTYIDIHAHRRGIVFLKSFFYTDNAPMLQELNNVSSRNFELYTQKLNWIRSADENKIKAARYITHFFKTVERNHDLQPITSTPKMPQKRLGLTNSKFKL